MRILYLDDEPSNRLVMSDMFAVAGLEAVYASDLNEALALWAGADPQLVLADLRVIGVSGLAHLSKLQVVRRRAGQSAVHITAATTDLTALTHAQYLEAGADTVIVKPIAFDALLAIVREVAEDMAA